MTTRQTSTRRRGVALRAATGILAAVALSLSVAQPAAAHDELLGSVPSDGDVLTASPADVTLKFSDEILTIGAVVVVVDTAGATWSSGDVRLDGTDVAADLTGDLPDGGYEIRWRVVSSDGHPIAGVIPFAVGEGSVPGAAEAAGTAADGSTPAAADPVDTGQDRAVDARADGGAPVVRLLLVGAIGAVAALGLLLLLGRRRRRSARPGTHDA